MIILLYLLLAAMAVGITVWFYYEFKKLFIHIPITINTELVTLDEGNRLHMQNNVPVWIESRGPFILKNTDTEQLIEVNQAEDLFSKSVNKIYMKTLAQFEPGTWEIKEGGENVIVHFNLPASGYEDSRIWAKVAYSIVFGGLYLILLSFIVLTTVAFIQTPTLFP